MAWRRGVRNEDFVACRGFVACRRRPWDGLRYFLPLDQRSVLRRTFLRRRARHQQSVHPEQMEAVHDNPLILLTTKTINAASLPGPTRLGTVPAHLFAYHAEHKVFHGWCGPVPTTRCCVIIATSPPA